MTEKEFYDWVDYHGASFDAWKNWLDKQGRLAKQQAYEVLKGCELLDARAATMELLAGDLEQPKGFGAVVTVIRRRCYVLAKERAGKSRQEAKEKPRKFMHGRQVFDCPLCRDDGLIEVWHPKTIQAAIHGESIEPVKTSWAACSCKAGDEHTSKRCFDSETRKHETREFPRLGCHPSVILFETWEWKDGPDGPTDAKAIRNDAGLQDYVANRERLIVSAHATPADEWSYP